MEKVFLLIFEERNNVFVREFMNININIRRDKISLWLSRIRKVRADS